MANISSAQGQIVINEELLLNGAYAVRTFLNLVSLSANYVDYDTYIDFENSISLLEDAIKDVYELSIDFDGTGRWSYTNNVESFYEMLEYVASQCHCDTEFRTMIEYFTKSGIPIEIKFVDMEQGAELYYGAMIEILPYINEETQVATMTRERGEEWQK